MATPIGNLQDITLRALETLRSVDVIAAEDTRHSARLLAHYGIRARLVALHEHNEQDAGRRLMEILRSGQSVALISDAGTPAISDPGAMVVHLARCAGIRVVPIPGASAVITALSASGLLTNGFMFVGFLPPRNTQRKQVVAALRDIPVTLAFYEAPHRILESMADLASGLGGARNVTIARELTKTFETIHTCRLEEAVDWLKSDPNRQRGEFVLLVEGASEAASQAIPDHARRTLEILLAELPLKQAVKLAAEISGAKKNALYDLALTLKPDNEE